MNSKRKSAISNDPDQVDNSMWDMLYDELKVLAKSKLRGEVVPDLLQPTALVNEAWLRLAGHENTVKDRQHFMCMAARVMRHVLIDQARALNRKKRGNGKTLLTLNSRIPGTSQQLNVTSDILDIDAALIRLAKEDKRYAKVLELYYFGGMSYTEIADVLELSEATIKRDLRSGRAWLLAEIESEDER